MPFVRALPLLALALMVAACDTGGPPEVQVAGSFEATLTGATEATLTGSAGALGRPGGDGVSVQLLPAARPEISLSLLGSLEAVGTYAVDPWDLAGAQSSFRESRSILFGIAGEIRVTRVTADRIEGTFAVDYAARPRPDAPIELRAEGTFSAVRLGDA